MATEHDRLIVMLFIKASLVYAPLPQTLHHQEAAGPQCVAPQLREWRWELLVAASYHSSPLRKGCWRRHSFLVLFPLVAKVFHSWLEGKWTFHLNTQLYKTSVDVWELWFYPCVSGRSVRGETGFLPPRLWPSRQHQHSPECPIPPRRSVDQSVSQSFQLVSIKHQPAVNKLCFILVSILLDRRKTCWHFENQATEMPAYVSVSVGILEVVQ